MRKDKKQVIGEELNDAQVRRFLLAEPPAGVARDFHILERAYRGLRAHDFDRFLVFFVAEGHDVNATNPCGESLGASIARHAQGNDYVEALRRHGAA
jgi:hypothetical protein